MAQYLTFAAAAGNTMWFTLGYLVCTVAIFYFIAIRPQNKQKKQQEAMLSTLEVGDSILTTSGFYGVVIDVMDEVVIVEFGNNKNCRIPMQKAAIVQVEKGSKEA